MTHLEKVIDKSVKGFVHDDKSKKTHPRKQFIINKFVEFCKRTDLHGYKYIVMEDFSITERICWAFAVMISIVIAISLLILAYKWYARNPIVTVIESTQGAIWEVPFPAITVCDLNMVSRRAARNFSETLQLPENLTSEFIFKTLKFIPLLLAAFPSDPEQKVSLKVLQTVLDANNITIDELFRQLSPANDCKNLIQRCMWKNTVYPCEYLFTPIFTSLGLCCTFNYFAVDEPENISKRLSSMVTGPLRVASCGYQTALTVLLYTDTEDYYSATVASQGSLSKLLAWLLVYYPGHLAVSVKVFTSLFARREQSEIIFLGIYLGDDMPDKKSKAISQHPVMIDNAYNVPDFYSTVRMVNPSTELLIGLSPETTYSTEGIKSFKPQERQCYYNNERQLGGFRHYSFHNCMAYEKVQFLVKICRCAPLSFPLKESYPRCNFKDLECMDKVFRRDIQIENNSRIVSASECLPECEHYDYLLEVALGNLASKKYVTNQPFFDDISLINRSLLNVFFNDLVSTRYRRDVYLNWQNILAAFGGLLSLMLGFTLLAGFDVVIFFTIRVAYDFFAAAVSDIGRNKVWVQEYKHNHKTDGWMENAVSVGKEKRSVYKPELYHGHNRY